MLKGLKRIPAMPARVCGLSEIFGFRQSALKAGKAGAADVSEWPIAAAGKPIFGIIAHDNFP
jgi:hypothetical protein